MLKNIKIFFLIVLETFKRKWQFNSLLLLATLAFFFLFFRLSPIITNTNAISEGLIGTYQEYDLPDVATNLLSKGLVKMDEHNKPIPALSSGWEINNDATRFTFKLKPGLFWTNGTPLRSEDLEFSIPDVDVSYPDPETVQFDLKDSFSAFPSILVKPVFKKGHHLLGVGPYRVTKIYKSVIFITKITLTSQDKQLPKVTLRFYPNEKIALTAFSLGEVESLLGISNISQWESHPKTETLEKLNYSRIVTILYNVDDPVLGNRSLRQALSYSAPSLKEDVRAKTPIAPISWAYTTEVNDYLGNFEVAKQALARARSTMRPEDLEKPIILTVIPQLSGLGEQIKQAWEGLGLKVTIRTEPGIPQNFQALLIIQTIPDDPDQYSLWHSTQTKTNLTKYSSKCCPQSARVDRDLEEGRKLIREEDRREKYHDFQRILLEDSPATFLYFPKYNIVYLSKVKEKQEKVLNLQLPI